jgi:hypothetical protein
MWYILITVLKYTTGTNYFVKKYSIWVDIACSMQTRENNDGGTGHHVLVVGIRAACRKCLK